MTKAKIYYIHPCDIRATRDEKMAYLQEHKFQDIPFEHIQPDKNGNWINLTDNDWDELIPVANKETKLSKKKSEENAIFRFYSQGVKTNRDDWVFDLSSETLKTKMQFFIDKYNKNVDSFSHLSEKEFNNLLDYKIKWSSQLKINLQYKIKSEFSEKFLISALYRPYVKKYFYCDKNFNDRLTINHYHIFGKSFNNENFMICFNGTNTVHWDALAINKSLDYNSLYGGIQCLPLYRYDTNGNRYENITDWGLEQFRERYEGRGTRDVESGKILETNGEKYGQANNQIVSGSECLAGSDVPCGDGLPNDKTIPEGGNVRTDESNSTSGSLNTVEHSGGASKEKLEGVSSISINSERITGRTGNPGDDSRETELHQFGKDNINPGTSLKDRKYARSLNKSNSKKYPIIPRPTFHAPRPIEKEDIFYYTYGVLHNPEYRKKYELNLKREFPRIPFYDDFWVWSQWGKELMDLHINFEQAEKFPLQILDSGFDKARTPNAKLRADKENGIIILDEQTSLTGIPKEAWQYKLGNRSALEWILDQYKEKKPKDPTIREKFNTYKFADYKAKVIDLLMRVTTVSIKTMKIVNSMNSE